jgi:hypothetical protein
VTPFCSKEEESAKTQSKTMGSSTFNLTWEKPYVMSQAGGAMLPEAREQQVIGAGTQPREILPWLPQEPTLLTPGLQASVLCTMAA